MMVDAFQRISRRSSAFARKFKLDMPLLSAVDSINSHIGDKKQEEITFLTSRVRSHRRRRNMCKDSEPPSANMNK